MKKIILVSAAMFFLAACSQSQNGNKAILPAQQNETPLDFEVKLPEGFHISVFADNVENARSMALGNKGTVFVGNRSGDKVYALIDEDNDYKIDKKITIAEGLNMPNGVAFHNGDLYVAEVSKIWKYPNIEANLNQIPQPILIYEDLPSETHHGWKYIAVGPDNKLYVPIGAPCNVCEKEDPRYASITRMDLDGKNFEVYASGIRNSVGFDWHPITKDLWFTDNGRDMMGDDVPTDELNTAAISGLNFGFPYCHQGDVLDPDFGKNKNCEDYIAPAQKLKPHAASLGMLFYTGDMFPEKYKNQIFIAEHGSWNRSTKIGYDITLAELDSDNKTVKNFSDFATGWLGEDQNEVHGRPVDIIQLKDGSILVSDDFSNKIYRITYRK